MAEGSTNGKFSWVSGSAEAGTEFTANVAYYPYAEGMVLSGDQGYEISNVALPPTNFEKGFTVTVTTVDGCVAELVAPENEVKRSGILVMPELAVNALIPVTLETEAGMTDVGLNVTIDHEAVTGFYGMFLMPGVWENVKMSIEYGYFGFSDILAGAMGQELPCYLYEGQEVELKLSEFGIAPEYFEYDVYN